MAYAFDKIMNMVDPKIDVFGQSQPGGQGGQNQTQSQGGTGETKSTTDGDVSGGGTGGTTAGGASASVAPASTASMSSQAAFTAAQNQPQSKFKPFADIGQKLKANETALQDEANTYVASQKAKQTYDIGDSDIDKAVAGDADAKAKASGLISKATINPFDKYEQKVNPYVSDLEKFKSEPGLTGYFRSLYGPGYSRGQASFDIGRLQSDPQYFSDLRGLQGTQQDLEKKAAGFFDPTTGAESQVDAYGKQNLASAKSRVGDYLSKLRGDLEGTNAGELKAYQDELEKLKTDAGYRGSKVAGGLADPGIKTSISQAIAANPELQKYLTPESIAAFGLNPADYAKLFSGELNADMFYDATEANRFNNINSILGVGGAGKVAGNRPGDAATFDTAGYSKAAIDRATGKNTAANEAARANIERLKGEIAARRARAQESQKGVNYDDIKSNLKNSMVGNYSRMGRDLGQLQAVDINPFFKGMGEDLSNDADFLTQEEADQWNAANEELMDSARLGAGRYSGGYNPNNWTFDSTGYDAALAAIGMAPPPPPPPTPPPPMVHNKSDIPAKTGQVMQDVGKFGQDVNDVYQQVIDAPGNILEAITPPVIKNNPTVKKVGRGVKI